MGNDVRGIEGGKCACGECEDFMRYDGATCGYCGCLPTRHSKKDARYSSDSVDDTSAARTSESTGPEKWKDKDLGWFPNPKGEYHRKLFEIPIWELNGKYSHSWEKIGKRNCFWGEILGFYWGRTTTVLLHPNIGNML